MRILRDIWRVVLNAAREFIRDDALTNAAAIAFYTALSFAPLLILLLWIASAVGEAFQVRIVEQIEQLVGPNAAESVDLVIHSAEQTPSAGSIAGLISLGSLLFSATGVFAQLQKAMNQIWDVEAAEGSGLWNFLRMRLVSLGMMVAVGFLLVTSLIVSTVLAAVISESVVETFETLISLGLFTLVFAALFKFVPDVDLPWRVTWLGAAFTSILFVAGQFAIGTYLGVSSIGSAYGAAGSLLVLLVWVYYASLIVFYGAEVSQQVARHLDADVRPSRHARWTAESTRRRDGDAKHGGRTPAGEAP